ncbi:MAG: nuclear transport factor 2 family protein [Bacteroidetes bacterium]|nr:nuclear transport factor 2 family protein [Fibrella sp.]
MKLFLLTFLIALLLVRVAMGQQPTTDKAVEQEIRRLEQGQVDYLLQGDTLAIAKQWSPDYVVNNPFNQAVNASQGPVRQGNLTYSAFTRDVEKVLIHGQTAIAMGGETVVPSGKSANAGKTIKRRFTDVWMNTTGKWLLVARHASVICQGQ